MDPLALDLLVGLLILLGLAGVLVPALPGVLLVWGAVLFWAAASGAEGRWLVFALVSVLAAAGQVLKYLIPGRRLQAAGVPKGTLLLGGGLALAGFFVVPVVGAVLGFVAGVYLAERARLGSHARAWPSTVAALRGALLAVLIELSVATGCAGVWLAAVLAG